MILHVFISGMALFLLDVDSVGENHNADKYEPDWEGQKN
jgi:hypothetical protein